MLQERDQRGRDRDELLRRDVLVVDLVALGGDELAVEPRDDAVLFDPPSGVRLGVGLGDDVILLLPGRQVEGEGHGLRRTLAAALPLFVLLLELLLLDDLGELEGRVADGRDLEVVDDPSLLDPLVGRLDEAEVVDARVARERRDQPDVRAFRRLDRAHPSVVRRVHVADLEPRPLAGESTRSEGAQAALVRDLRQRVRLVHELRELGGPEELLDRGDHGLAVDQIVRHRGVDVLVHGHLFLDGPLHPHEPDPELVLEELADRADAPVAEVIDVVRPAHVPLQPQEIADYPIDVLGGERPGVFRGVRFELDVELEAADAREVVLLRVEEHALEEVLRGFVSRRVARAKPAVDLEDRLVLRLVGVLADRVDEDVARQVPVGEEELDGLDAALLQLLDRVGPELLSRLEEHFAARKVDDVREEAGLLDGRVVDGPFNGALLRDFLLFVRGQLDPAENELRVALDASVLLLELLLLQGVLPDGQVRAPALEARRDRRVELPEDRLVRLEAEGPKEDRRRKLPLAVDPDVQDALLVVLELDPGTAVRDDFREESVGGLLREEHSRRAVELGHDDALGAVDDEGSVLRHERNVAEENLFLLGVPHGLDPRLGVLVVDEEPERHLERNRIGHAPFLAFRDGILHLQIDGVPADVAEGHPVGVLRAAVRTRHLLLVRVGRDDPRSAGATVHPEVLQALQPPALALPVPDRVLDELQLASPAEVGERKHARKDGLEPRLVPLLGEQVHLEEPLVGAALDVD